MLTSGTHQITRVAVHNMMLCVEIDKKWYRTTIMPILAPDINFDAAPLENKQLESKPVISTLVIPDSLEKLITTSLINNRTKTETIEELREHVQFANSLFAFIIGALVGALLIWLIV